MQDRLKERQVTAPKYFLSCPGVSHLADNIIGFRTSVLLLPESDLILNF